MLSYLSVFILEAGIVCVFSFVFEIDWEITSELLKLFSVEIIFVSEIVWLVDTSVCIFVFIFELWKYLFSSVIEVDVFSRFSVFI